jgi:SAM-dependent methyltransferase
MDHHHDHTGTGPASAEAYAALLDLDAEVLHDYLADAISWVGGMAANLASHRIVDLGSGTGDATVALAQAFPHAEVLAVDNATDLLARITTKARDLGVADRITTLHADLDDPWPIMEAVDVVWASMSLHHFADPGRVLADVFAGLRPGGLVAVAEMDGLPRFLPDDLGIGRPGLEARCHTALAEAHARQMPSLGSDWGPRLSNAGFATITKRTFAIDVDPPLPASAGRYAQTFLRHVRSQLDGTIAAADRATLDTLIESDGPHSILRRHDLAIRGTRTIWVGTRP